MESDTQREYEVIGVDRYNREIHIRWFNRIFQAIVIPCPEMTREQLIEYIERHRPTVTELNYPGFDIAEKIIKNINGHHSILANRKIGEDFLKNIMSKLDKKG